MIENIGYHAIDTLSIRVLSSIVETGRTYKISLALGLYVRSENFDAENIKRK